MPIFEYICRECSHRFERIVQGSSVPDCPSCHTHNLEKQISGFAVGGTAGSWATTTSPSACGSCGDPRGPGSCSMN